MNLEKLKIFLLGAITVLLAVLVFGNSPVQVERAIAADSAGMSVEGLLAMLGENNDLFIIDARNQRLAVYDFSKSSGRITLKAARNFSNDLRVNKEIVGGRGLDFDEVKELLGK
ncbi:MAG: hypothetical protein JXA52_08935 [Planctomycetes bacterium]|nr:hypothetical protein [Planctomycetota bacterium]